MIKTLLISYTPRVESNTAKLVDTVVSLAGDKADITHLDLVKEPPPLLLGDNLNALLKRNFMGMSLTEAENNTVRSADKLLDQLLAADRIVIAFPMYNFSLPAAIKAWVDAVIQKERTFTISSEGAYQGLCQGKKSLILMTTGSDFNQESMKNLNYATPLLQSCMGFMGIASHVITAYGLNQYMDHSDKIVGSSQQEISAYLDQNAFW